MDHLAPILTRILGLAAILVGFSVVVVNIGDLEAVVRGLGLAVGGEALSVLGDIRASLKKEP